MPAQYARWVELQVQKFGYMTHTVARRMVLCTALEEWQLTPEQRSQLRQPHSLLATTRTSCRSRVHVH